MKFSISNSIKTARETFAHLNNDDLVTSIGDIWSIKKILLLDYYMPAFSAIIGNPKNNFKKWYYADPFCGSGIFSLKDPKLKNKNFPGSALIGALNASKLEYTGCIFSEKESKNVDALNTRLQESKDQLNNKEYSAQTLDFEKSVEKILEIREYQVAVLILIDPDGYAPIKWRLMEKLIKEVGIDIILNFYTHRIAQNVSASKKKPKHEKNINEFFGDERWKKVRDTRANKNTLGEKLLDHYLSKVQRVSNKTAISIGVYKDGDNKLYDLILITRSTGGASVMRQAKKVMDDATTEAIKREFKVQAGSQSRLSEHGFQ